MLLMGIVQVVSVCSNISIPERKNNKPQKYALLIGGGITEGDNFESYYKNIEYAFNTLKKFGYCDEVLRLDLADPISPKIAGKPNAARSEDYD